MSPEGRVEKTYGEHCVFQRLEQDQFCPRNNLTHPKGSRGHKYILAGRNDGLDREGP